MPMTRLRATRGSTTVSPPTAVAVCSVVAMPEDSGADASWPSSCTDARRAAR